jgi:hypothetical protein
VTAIDVADLVVIARQVLGIGSDAVLDQLDLTAARAALAEAQPATGPATGAAMGPAMADPGDAGLAAAALMRALLRHPPFSSHRQQIAVAAGLQFLALNGWQATLDPPEAAVVVVEGLAAGQLSPADAAAWLSPRLVKEIPMRTRLPRMLRALDPRPQVGVFTPLTGFIPFSDDAGDVVVLARAEADRLGLGQPGPEQFLLALLDQGVAARVLKRLGISSQAVREQMTQASGPDQRPVPSQPFPMQVMPRAVSEVVAHGQDYIGTEHILLALFHAGDNTAARALASLGAAEREVRAAITAATGHPHPARHRGRKPVPRDDEIRRLRREVARLSELLREHGIEPLDRKSA